MIHFFLHKLVSVALLSLIVGLLILCLAYFTVSNPLAPNTPTDSVQQLFVAPSSFTDVSFQHNLTHSHIQHTGEISDLIDVTSAGACVDDFDNDGWIDILFTGGGGLTRFYGDKSWWQSHNNIQFYRNDKGTFEQAKNITGLEVPGSTTSCAAADFDLDGHVDIVIGTTKRDFLFKNNGDLTFSSIPLFSQLTNDVWTSHISIADIDNDGDPDIHLSHFLRYQKNQKSLENATGFSEQHQRQFDANSFDGLRNQLLRNQGQFEFDDVTSELGLNDLSERSVSANWYDFDEDNRQDLIVLNRSDQPIRVFLNKPLGFQLATSEKWILQANNNHSFSQGQEINDAFPISMITRPAGLASLVSNIALGKTPTDMSWTSELVNHQQIYLNYWGAFFADLNNDGFTDSALASGGYQVDPFAHKMTIPSANICATQQHQNALVDAPKFSLKSCFSGANSSSRGAIKLDFNNDGKIDILFANNNDFPQLLENNSIATSRWIALDIAPQQRFQYAKIKVSVANKEVVKSVSDHSALFGQHDPRIHFGLGNLTQVLVSLIDKSGEIVFEQVLDSNLIYQLQQGEWVEKSFLSRFEQTEKDSLSSVLDSIRFSLGQGFTQAIWDKSQYLLVSLNEQQNAELARLLNDTANIRHLGLYHLLLDSKHIEVMQASMQAIKKVEHESSVRDLLYRLDNAQSQQFCAIADTFAHWFQEEEAVVRSKYKAVPHLIRRLDDKDPSVVACSANALGHSEHANAASAILDSYHQAPIESRPELVKALGNIRQGEAIPLLRNLVANSNNIEVIQQAIIALTRLNDLSLGKHIKAGMNNNAQHAFLTLAIATIEHAQDSVVVGVEDRHQWLSQRRAININFALLPNQGSKKAYLRAAYDNQLTLPHLVDLQASLDASLLNLAAKQKLRLNRLKNDELEIILSLELDDELHYYLSKASEHFATLAPISTLTNKQLNNLLNIFAVLNKNQMRTLFSTINQRASLFTPKVTPQHMLQNCTSAKANYKTDILDHADQSILSLFLLCELARNINQLPLGEIGDQISAIYSSQTPNYPINRLLNELAELLSPNLAKKLSAAVLFQSDLDKQLKAQWAIEQPALDQYKKNWLTTHLMKDEDLVNQLLSQNNGYLVIKEIIEKRNVATSEVFSEKTVQRMRSYAHLYQYMVDHP